MFETSTPTITLQAFCTALSATDKRAELIGAFHHAQVAAKHLFDTHDNFQLRFVTFCSAPA
jgi:hypothetical protein